MDLEKMKGAGKPKEGKLAIHLMVLLRAAQQITWRKGAKSYFNFLLAGNL
jgi:hypothetical protein